MKISSSVAKQFLLSSFLLLGIAGFSQDSVPALNREVIEFVKTTIGKKVDRGECWDLANKALTLIKADWDLQYKYGKLVNHKKETVYPGDIIQFEGVKVKYKKGNTTYTESMEHHTAIVYRVIDKGVFELAHQNTGFSGRKVGLSTLDISTIIKGKMSIYRPVKK
ncbi:MAG: hypothetical protein EHM93_07735 [Bacteroidales bacterium]|nr:MAG: hypothetical protein EHM93_07735 [Bacteroidales bacterium]